MFKGKLYGADQSAGCKAIGFDDAAIGQGLAFLNGELEKRNTTLNEPLSSFTYARDIFIEAGGGFVENISNMFVDYRTTGGNEDGIINNITNDIPVIQPNLTKDLIPAFPWSVALRISFLDQKKMAQTGRGLDELLNKGVKLSYNKTLDNRVYVGMDDGQHYGLVNNPTITAMSASTGASGSKTWASKTPDEILMEVNEAMTKTWEQSEYDLRGMCNQILVDPVNYSSLVTRKVSEAGNVSILSYLLENNIGKNQGVDLVIVPSRWCTGAGVGNTNRMVCYANDKDMVNIAVPQPLTKVMTTPSAEKVAYFTTFMANISVVNFKYKQHALYIDGI